MISDKIENTNIENVAISNKNVDTIYFDIDTSCKKIGIKKTSLYTKYLTNKKLNIQKYHIQGSKKTYLHIDDINIIKTLEQKKIKSFAFNENISRKQKSIQIKSSSNNREYDNNLNIDSKNTESNNNDSDKLIKIYKDMIEELKKDKENLQKDKDKLSSTISELTTTIDKQQVLALKDKNQIEVLTLALKESNNNLMLSASKEDCLRDELNSIKNMSLGQKILFLFKK